MGFMCYLIYLNTRLQIKKMPESEFYLPMFLPCFFLGALWLLSFDWLVNKYCFSMTPEQQRIIWAGLQGHAFQLWCISALLSCAAALSSWIMLFSIQSADPDQQSRWDSVYILPLPLIVLSQILYNAWVVQRHVWPVCAVLWLTIGCTIWIWYCCWTLFRNHIWLHVLNANWILHCALWDAGIWFFTWRRSLSERVKQTDNFLSTVTISKTP